VRHLPGHVGDDRKRDRATAGVRVRLRRASLGIERPATPSRPLHPRGCLDVASVAERVEARAVARMLAADHHAGGFSQWPWALRVRQVWWLVGCHLLKSQTSSCRTDTGRSSRAANAGGFAPRQQLTAPATRTWFG